MSPIKSRIRTVEDWPKKCIMFRDITTNFLLKVDKNLASRNSPVGR